jgi:hypothetical protein
MPRWARGLGRPSGAAIARIVRLRVFMLRAPTIRHWKIEIYFGFRASDFEFGCVHAALG